MQNQHNNIANGGETRRRFLKQAALATMATPVIIQNAIYGQSAPSANVTGANEKIVLGFIGVGPQGMYHLRNFVRNASKWNVAVGAVCDLWIKRREEAKAAAGGNVQVYEDYRKLLEQKDIDAVVISTPTHQHAQPAIDTVKAGKHIYLEKPMTRYLDEAWALYEAVKQAKVVFQLGAQGCSDAKWHKVAELVRNKMMGPLILSQSSYMRNNPKGEWNYNIDPDFKQDGIDWEKWLGPKVVDRVGFSPEHFFRWRKYYQYCTGILGDLLPHRLHPLMLATANPEFPIRVSAIGVKKIFTDKNTPGAGNRDVPENLTVIAEFPSGLTMILAGSTVNEYGLEDVVRGHCGTALIGGMSVQYKPERPFTDEFDPERFDRLTPVESVEVHEENWIECIRTGKTPNANIELAIRAQTVISLAEMADRLGITCIYNPETKVITDGTGRKLQPITYGTIHPS